MCLGGIGKLNTMKPSECMTSVMKPTIQYTLSVVTSEVSCVLLVTYLM